MLLNPYAWLMLSPDEGGGGDAEAGTATTTAGDGESPDAKTGQAQEAEKVDRAAFEKVKRDYARAQKALDDKTAAEAEAAKKAAEEQGKWKELYDGETKTRQELETKHARELKRLSAKAELNRYQPLDPKDALLVLEAAEGFDDADDTTLADFVEKFVGAKPHLFKGNEGEGVVPKTQAGQSALKGKPVDVKTMTPEQFRAYRQELLRG